MLQNIIRSLMHIPSGLFLNDTNINVRRTKESQTQKDVEYNFLFFSISPSKTSNVQLLNK